MNIIGIGIDIIEILRIQNIFVRFKNKLANKILTMYELYKYEKCHVNKINFLAKHFAVKEAAVKAINTGFTKGILFKHIELCHNNAGKPKLVFYNQALYAMKKKCENYNIHVSLSDEKKYVCALVIIEANKI
ncbi:holo-ACP synthase [Enterobacteriaceae endosymbiont of Neohaemonia nigricornis]|uniref:holo-ACP synthase n=1 Tax=Enterobacteriaceae endosymbiont of Neohaemonia nigricornis TaxID=2675792 RepID=UPI001449DD5D|nr:holo-ACP synthase [Enterobacteriaceae endosymbiont of Neohaemonia nigricornis]QJC30363.1 holo-ACP synthase [Enterobacteriaceae endosymbiont of Neohaemonia nigricornis]